MEEDAAIEEVVVTARAELLGFREAYANNTVDAEALQADNSMVDALSRINRLPGVNVTQGDAVGGNDWSTRIYIRGMSNGTDTAQIGYMVDGMPNGDSVYGGGQKPGTFVDNENIATVQVGQNTADIGSASNSALGGTIRYVTTAPADHRRLRLDYTGGDYALQRLFLRADSGELKPGLASYLSVSDSRLQSWIGTGAGRFDHQHVDLKVVKASATGTTATLKASWNYRNENDYNSITLADFRANPKSDGLLDDFDIHTAGIWRPAWGGTRWDTAAALEVQRRNLDKGSGAFAFTPYYHRQRGWGWWVPPYRIATLDGSVEGDNAVREYYRGTFGRDAGGGLLPAPATRVAHLPCLLGFYRADTVDYALAEGFDCVGAERIASRRRSGYWNERFGVTGETRHVVRRHTLTVGGWLERQDRANNRQWFDLDRRDPGTLSPALSALHWTHFDRRFETTSQRFFVQDRLDLGRLQFTAGLVYHAVEDTLRLAARCDAASAIARRMASETGCGLRLAGRRRVVRQLLAQRAHASGRPVGGRHDPPFASGVVEQHRCRRTLERFAGRVRHAVVRAAFRRSARSGQSGRGGWRLVLAGRYRNPQRRRLSTAAASSWRRPSTFGRRSPRTAPIRTWTRATRTRCQRRASSPATAWSTRRRVNGSASWFGDRRTLGGWR